MSTLSALVSEVFDSIQGEGLEMGRRAVFLRLAGCNLTCDYCDTVYARKPSKSFVVYSGNRRHQYENPFDLYQVLSLLREEFPLAKMVVLTGGEPLVQVGAVSYLAAGLRQRGCRIILETNGTLPGAYYAVRDLVDFLCLDIKMPSSQAGRSFFREHLEFLRAMKGRAGCAKIILTGQTSEGEIDEAVELVAKVNPFVPVYLQPASDRQGPRIDPERIMALQSRAARRLRDVRVSVQMHRLLRLR